MSWLRKGINFLYDHMPTLDSKLLRTGAMVLGVGIAADNIGAEQDAAKKAYEATKPTAKKTVKAEEYVPNPANILDFILYNAGLGPLMGSPAKPAASQPGDISDKLVYERKAKGAGYVDIWANGNNPEPQDPLRELKWTYTVWNYSDQEVTRVKFSDLPSTDEPDLYPHGKWWTKESATLTADNLWTLIIVYDEDPIPPYNGGPGEETFEIKTYRSASLPGVPTGTRYGQGWLKDWEDWSQPDDFIGPTPYLPFDVSEGSSDPDGRINQADLDAFEACATGPEIPVTAPGCDIFMIDLDADIDQSDFGLLQVCISGEEAYSTNCLPADLRH